MTVWTGKEMLIWGGVEVRGPPGTQPSAGATPPGAYEPASDTWRTLPAGPLDVVAGAVGGWTGRELVIWGGVDGDQRGAAFEPCSNRWRSTAPAPIEPRDMVASVWTGRELLFWGGNTRTNFPLSDGAAYDPARDTWRVLPPVSVRGYYAPEPVWTGAEMLVWGWSNLALDRAAENETVAYNAATTQWRTVPRAPLVPPVDQYEGTLGGRVAWTGESLLAWSGTLDAEGPLVLELDPRTDQWKRLPLPPAASPLAPEIVWTGYELIVLGAGPDHSALAMRLSAR
ncbi:MAG: hypothetical protein ACRDZ1_15730 [Acidimicrobiia bacterium]